MAEHCELINRGAEFNLDEMDGEPVLFYAAKNNLPLVVKRLSDAGLDLNATDDEGKTALFYANRNNNMDVLCELIRLGVEFKLDEINGKAVLFHAAKNECKHVIKPLYDAHLDLDITDEQGKTVVFYGNKDFLDALMEVVGCLNENGKVCVNARDHYGRTPLFYAIQDNDTTKAWYLIEKGTNLQLRDNCNVTIFTLYAENCISKIGETENLLHSKLFEERQQLQKAVALEIFNTLYCQASLFSVGSFPRQIKSYTISRKENILDALGVIQQHCLFKDDKEVAIINELVVFIDKKNEIDIPRILSLLIRLGTNPQATDSHGNTALHYATLLPLFGVTQKVVLDICKKLRNFGALLDAKNHQCESPLLFSLSSSVWEVITENNNWHSSISGFAEVCKFLLNNINDLQNADTIFHRIISLVQLGLEFSEEVSRNAVVKVLIDVLELLQPEEQAVKNAVNHIDSLLNSPLHLWASIGLKSPQDYTRSLTGDFTFERILKRILDHLLKCGANVNARNVNDETPLHKCKTWTAVKLLLDAKANPNDHNTSGCSPLLAAAKKSNVRSKTGHLYPDVTVDLESFWRTALEKKLDPWMADNQGETLLNVLNKSEDFALTRALVEVACYEKSIRDDVKTTILNFIRQDESKHVQWKPDVVDKLNDGVLEPPRREAKTDESETKEEPLHHRSLTEDKTALFYANRHNVDALCKLIECDAEFILDEIDAKAVLFHAAEYDYSVTVDKLDDKFFDLNITDDDGKTAVFYANRNHSMDALCKLIECGAEFMLDEIDAKAVLFHAAEYNYSVTVDELDDRDIDLNITDDEGKTAVFYANRNHSMDALCKLIECDAEFKLNEIDAKAVVFHAAEYNYSVIVEKLHNKKFDLNMTNDEGKTALFYANRNHSMDALCELIKCGAEFKLDEIDELAVLFYAAKNEYIDVVKPLCYAGLDLNVTEDHGKTVVLYGNEDFLVEEIFKDASDYFLRTSYFYAHHDDDTTKARYLIKKGANRQLKDNCNVSIFNFFVGISGNLGEEKLFISNLFGKELYWKALTRAIFNILYCQAPLLSVNARFSDLLKSFAIFSKTNALEALAFAKLHCLTRDVNEVENIAKNIRGKEIDVPRILSSLMNLGADPQTADSDGNTAFHYATLLPLCGVTQEIVMGICKKLKRFGTIFHAKNHQHQSPLLFCLSSSPWNVVTENNSWRSSIRGLFKVFRFLVSSRNVIPNSEFIFHRIISLIKQGLNLNDKSQRKAVVQVLLDILELLQPHQDSVRNAVNYTDTLLNSPLHLWASIELKTPQDYKGFGTEDFTFESILKRILNHLLTCGVQRNARNVNDETPLHRCRTWIAVKLLLDAGANPNDQNSSGSSALLVTAKNKNAPTKTGHLYPDVTDDPESFWNCAVQKGLDPWIVDKQGETIMNVLIKSEDFELSKALVEVTCKEESTTDNVKLSILNVICNDESKNTHWKTILVDIILKSPGANRLALESPLRLCCRNMLKFGMFDNGQPVSEIQQREIDKPSYDDGQPLPKKARVDESEKKEEKKQESKEEQISNDSVYRKIAKQLRLCAPDIDIDAIANDYPSLQDLFTKPVETDKIPILVPWASVSAKHKAKLAKVARKREVTVAGQVWYHRNKIGNGSFGSIFAGINTKDGGEVAVKRIDKSRLERPEDKREIENLVRLADCAQVVRYISFFENEDFSHVVQELMEGNLVEFLSGCKTDAALATRLCKDVVLGLQFMHKEGILHRDLKPENILYKVHPKICLKIADFGLSRTIGSVSTTSVFGTLVGSRCWMAPEVFTSVSNSVDKTPFAEESDVFSCGMILHYILSGGKHPFSPKDCTNENALQVSHETETNIMNGNMCGWDKSLCPEATYLVKKMLERNESNRPSSAEALKHPLFWSNDKKLDFLVSVSKNGNFRAVHDPDIEFALRNSKHRAKWTNRAYKHMKAFHDEMSGYRNYRVKSVVDLVRFIRNVYEHYTENELKDYVGIESLLFTDYVFFNNFPNLVLEVYKYVTEHELDEAPEIKRVMNKEY